MYESLLGTARERAADLREHLALSHKEPQCIAEMAWSLVGLADLINGASSELPTAGAWNRRLLFIEQIVVALRYLAKLEHQHNVFSPLEYEYIERARDELHEALQREFSLTLSDFEQMLPNAREQRMMGLLVQIRMLYRGLGREFGELPPPVLKFWTRSTESKRYRGLLSGAFP